MTSVGDMRGEVILTPPARTVKRLGLACLVALAWVSSSTPAVAAQPGRLDWVVHSPEQTFFDFYDALSGSHQLAVDPTSTRVFVLTRDPSTGPVLSAYRATDGQLLWSQGNAQMAEGFGLAVSPDGERVFFVGSSIAAPSRPVTSAFDASTGAGLWASTYIAPFPLPSIRVLGSPITVDPGGDRVYVAVRGFPVAVVAYDATSGAELWTVTDDGWLSRADLVSDGGILYAVGDINKGLGGCCYRAKILAVRAADGQVLWHHTWAPHQHARGCGVAVDGPTVYMAACGSDNGVLAYSRSGERLMLAPVAFHVFGFDVAPGGRRLFVTGTNGDYLTAALRASDGSRIWRRVFSAAQEPDDDVDDDWAISVAAGPKGGAVYVTGVVDAITQDYELPPTDFGTIAYSADRGRTLWARRYDGPSHAGDWATQVLASPDGKRVFVTGVNSDGGVCNTATSSCTQSTLAYRA